jgi:uncharacterized protein YaeQ
MALKATIFKAELQVADMDRGHFANHSLTIARHPSEIDERMMVRLLAFALNADDSLAFTKGLSTDDEPDLWLKDLTGTIEQWIEVGQPNERRLSKACGRARRVIVYSYGGRAADTWWQKTARGLARLDNLEVIDLPGAAADRLATLAGRSMRLNCTVQDGEIWLADGERQVHVAPARRKDSARLA